MKIRNGFVSNSSSSSFVIVMKKKDFEGFYSQLDDVEKAIVNHVLDHTTYKLDDQEFSVMSGVTGNESSFAYFSLPSGLKLNEEQKDIMENDGFECWFDNIVDRIPSHQRIDINFSF